MSGIAAILNLDGEPVDQRLLGRMTESMAFRGPDDQAHWSDGCIGFCHTLLKTNEESEHDRQPLTLEGRVWIVADARIDSQKDLTRSLESAGQAPAPGATDAELILRAYLAWGEDCVERLLGDFSFAIWDAPQNRLFCARDHLGVKSLFYSQVGRTLVVSNTLGCVRLHPKVSIRLNDLAIADFLLFGVNQDPSTTSFADIRRVPPAHRAVWSPAGDRIERYWKLPIDEPIFYQSASDYTERFLELLETAVRDRLPSDRVGVFMSGGVDSASLAAMACRVFRGERADGEVRAFTVLLEGVADGRERHFADLVGRHLGIPVSYWEPGDRSPCTGEGGAQCAPTPEPGHDPTRVAAYRDYYRQVASHNRVCFYGEGPDNALWYEWQPYLQYLVRNRRFGRLVRDVCGHMVRHRRVPLLSTLVRGVGARRQAANWPAFYPDWLNEGLEARFGLRERWESRYAARAAAGEHPVRPVAYHSFGDVVWESQFRCFDAEQTRAPMEVRYPFVDLRLLRYMLAVPPVPWCRVKYLLRRSMVGLLPDQVLRRPKAAVEDQSGFPPKLDGSSCSPMLARFVDVDRLASGSGATQTCSSRFALWYAWSLSEWLQQLAGSVPQHTKENQHEASLTGVV